MALGLSCSMWPVDSSQLRDQTHVLTFAGGFFTTEPPGGSEFNCFKIEDHFFIGMLRNYAFDLNFQNKKVNTGFSTKLLIS